VDKPPENALQIAVDAHDERELVLTVGGEIDPYTAPQLETALEKAASDGGPQRIVVDLGGVGFLDSSGLRALISAHQLLKAAGRNLVLRNLRPTTKQLFEITQLVDEMNIE